MLKIYKILLPIVICTTGVNSMVWWDNNDINSNYESLLHSDEYFTPSYLRNDNESELSDLNETNNKPIASIQLQDGNLTNNANNVISTNLIPENNININNNIFNNERPINNDINYNKINNNKTFLNKKRFNDKKYNKRILISNNMEKENFKENHLNKKLNNKSNNALNIEQNNVNSNMNNTKTEDRINVIKKSVLNAQRIKEQNENHEISKNASKQFNNNINYDKTNLLELYYYNTFNNNVKPNNNLLGKEQCNNKNSHEYILLDDKTKKEIVVKDNIIKINKNDSLNTKRFINKNKDDIEIFTNSDKDEEYEPQFKCKIKQDRNRYCLRNTVHKYYQFQSQHDNNFKQSEEEHKELEQYFNKSKIKLINDFIYYKE